MNKIKLTFSEIIYIKSRIKNIELCEYLNSITYNLTELNSIVKMQLTYELKKELVRIAYTMPITNFSLSLFYKIINTIPDIFNQKFYVQSTVYGG